MSHIILDDSLHPLIFQTLHGVVDDAEIDEMIAWYDRLHTEGRGRYALILHGEIGHRPVTSAQRKRIAEWRKRSMPRHDPICVGTAVILESAVQRGAMKAINWLTTPLSPQKGVATRREAVEWCIRALGNAGVTVPEHVHRYHAELVSGAKRAR